jgi:hypothetical protein
LDARRLPARHVPAIVDVLYSQTGPPALAINPGFLMLGAACWPSAFCATSAAPTEDFSSSPVTRSWRAARCFTTRAEIELAQC